MNKHTIARRFSVFLLAAAMLVGGTRLASAQATLNSTTLGAALNGTALTVTVASTSGAAAGYLAFVDREALLVTAVNSSTSLSVQRGYNGTVAASHASGALTYLDRANYFYASEPGSGTCTAGAQVVTPHVNVLTGNLTACVNGRWQGTNLNPFTLSTFPRTPVTNVAYTVLPTDVIVAYTSLSAARTVTLPANMPAGHIVIVKDEIGLAATWNITVAGTINGSTNATISSNYGTGSYYSTGSGTWMSW